MAKPFLEEIEPRAIRSMRFIDQWLASRNPSADLHRDARGSMTLGALYVGEHRNKIREDWQKHQMKPRTARGAKNGHKRS